MNKEKIYTAALLGVFILELFIAFELNALKEGLYGKVEALGGRIDKVAIDTDGKLLAIGKKYEKLAEIKSAGTSVTKVQYIEKQDKSDADIELKEQKPKVTVKVNGGEKYNFDLLEKETAKFESGKLILEKNASLDLNLVTDEPTQSRWSVTTAANADKEALLGVSYRLGKSVSADVFVGQHIKPYYGLTWSIGSKN